MDYCEDLKREDFEFNDDYLIERFKRGSAAGFTFQQCCFHYLIVLALALGSTKKTFSKILEPTQVTFFLTNA